MNLFSYYQKKIFNSLKKLEKKKLIQISSQLIRFTVELPPKNQKADLSCNAAMVLAKPVQMSPINLANLIVNQLEQLPNVTGAQIAGPGFINIRLSANFWQDRLREILCAGTNYGN